MPAFPTIVNISSDHNHNINVADALKHRNMGDETKEKRRYFPRSHQASAAEFAEMCQELTTIVNSDPSFSASAVAAVKAFKRIKDNPSKIITALHMFGRYLNTGLASVRSRAIRRAAKPTAVARRRVRTPAPHSVSEGKSDPK